MSKIAVKYGYTPKAAAWARTGRGSGVVHVAAYTESGAGVETSAVCGVHVGWGTSAEFLTGWLCPKCAKEMGIRSMDDCWRDDDEAAWGDAQYGE